MSGLLLAVDTSGLHTSVALAEPGGVVAQRSLESRSSHNEVLAGLIEEIMTQTGKGFHDLSLLAVSIGPGSFTALRIGLLMLKGIAFARGLRIVPVMTLDALNASLPPDAEAGLRVPVVDAYKNEVFAALYRGGKRLTEPLIAAPQLLAEKLGRHVSDEAVTVFGPAVPKYASLLSSSFKNRMQEPDTPVAAVDIRALAMLAWERSAEAADPAGLEPFYLRKPDARRPHGKPDDAR